MKALESLVPFGHALKISKFLVTATLALAVFPVAQAGTVVGVTVSAPDQVLPASINVVNVDANDDVYGVYDTVGLAAGVPSTVSIVVQSDQGSALGYYADNLQDGSSLGDFAAYMTVSSQTSQSTGLHIYAGETSVSVGKIGGNLTVVGARDAVGMEFNKAAVGNISANVTVSGAEGVSGIVAYSTVLDDIAGNWHISGSAAESLVAGIYSFDSLSGYGKIGTATSSMTVTTAGGMAMAFGLYDSQGIPVSTLAGKVEVYAGDAAQYGLAAVFVIGEGTPTTAHTVHLENGTQLLATSVRTPEWAFVIACGRGYQDFVFSGEDPAGTYLMKGGVAMMTGSLRVENGTYLWTDLHTARTDALIIDATFGSTIMNVASSAKVVLQNNASLLNERFTVDGELIATAKNISDFSQVTIGDGTTFDGSGKITLRIANDFSSFDGEQMQLFVFTNATLDADLMASFTVTWEDGSLVDPSLWSFDAAMGIVTFGDIPEPAAAAGVLGILALALTARRRR